MNALNGASLAGATVSVASTGTGQTTTTTSDREGNFTIDQLPDDTYNLTATKSGYMDYEKKNVSSPTDDLVVAMIKENTTDV